jgi:hypothetical protein
MNMKRSFCQGSKKSEHEAGSWYPTKAGIKNVRFNFPITFYFSMVRCKNYGRTLILVVCSVKLCGLVVRVPGYRSRGLGFDFPHYHIFWEVVGLERGSLSLVSTTEELLERKSSDSDKEIREYGRRDPLCWPRNTLYPQKLALTLPTSDYRSVGTVRSRTQATEFVCLFCSVTNVFCNSIELSES